MKTAKLFIGAMAFAAILMAAPVAGAQENGNRDENGKVVRGSYLTNGLWDNWWVGVAGGVNFFGDGGWTPSTGGALEVNVGKWMTPCVGARVGYHGLTGAMWHTKPTVLGSVLDDAKDEYKQKFGFAYFHGDVMWNVSNAFGGYKETRFWNVIPYMHAGIIWTYNRAKADKFGDKEFAAGCGLLNNLRLCERVNLTLDVRGLLVNGKHHAGVGGVSGLISTTLGVVVNLGKTNWVRAENWHNPADVDKLTAAEASAAALTAANAALAADNDKLGKENAALNKEVEELRNRPTVVKAALENVTPAYVYFEIGQTVLGQKELEHLDFYLKNVLPNVDASKVTVLTGSADSKTGTPRRNAYLSKKRVEYVLNLLSEKYGIEADRFQVKTQVAKEGTAALNRAVIISFE